MKFKVATVDEITEIYNSFMVRDFPKDELKPLKSILQAVDKGWYKVYVAFHGDTILGYANVADCKGIMFLDYFAVNEKMRGTGIGTEFFRNLSCLTGSECILLEVESVESARNEEETELRKRRIAFYKRSGCIDTGCVYNVFGVEYNVFINRERELTPEFLSELLSAYEYAYAAILLRNDKSYIYRVK